MNTHYQTQKGMTLVEVLVALGISVVVMVAVSTFEVNIFRYKDSISGSFDTVQNVQVILKTMAKELRSASIASDGSFAIAKAATSTITFFNDSNTDGKKERIRYTFASSTVYRAVAIPVGSPLSYAGATESTSTLLRSVANGTSTDMFQYFDSSYDGSQSSLAQPVTPTTIRLINISVILTSGTPTLPSLKTYTTKVMFRNLKDNL